MNTRKITVRSLFLAAAMISFGLPGRGHATPPAARQGQPAQAITIDDDLFLPENWAITAESTGGASYSVNQQPSGGLLDSPFRFMSHSLPPVSGDELAAISVTHIYLGEAYDPGEQGAISEIRYEEYGIILSFPFPEAFSTTQPVVVQNGRIFRSPEFIRFIAQNSSHDWEVKFLFDLTAEDFVAVDGSGDHPDFSESGGPIQFGFTRTNTRSSTLPPVPPEEDLVIDQGVDSWRVRIERSEHSNRPPQAVDDVFILNGNVRSLPLLEFFDVVRNDSDPDRDRLEVLEVTEPLYGTAGIFSDHTVVYQLDEAQAQDSFSYTISDDEFTSSAQVNILVDCACTVLCLSDLELPSSLSPARPREDIDLLLMYRVRDQILKTTPDGQRYVDMYYFSNPEILVNILTNEPLRSEAVAAVELWQENLRSLADGDGSAVITQAQVDAVESFLNNLSAVSSAGLQQLIAGELARLGPLDDYVGLTMQEAKVQAIGNPTVYLPLTIR